VTNQIVRELAACKASDPYQRKPWAADQRGKWMTVNVPADLWERIQAACAMPLRECCNADCGWKGETDRMLGAVGPLCPECGEVTEAA
jgi:hypothetical protein